MIRILKKFWWVGVIILIVGMGYYRFGRKPAPKVETVSPQTQPISETLQISGLVDAEERADIPYGTGKISWVGVKEQQPVKKWQTIARMDTQSLQKQLQSDLNTFAKQWRTHDQTIDDTDYYTASPLTDEVKRMVESSGYDLQNAAIQVEIRDIAIKMSTISSPIEGIVTKLDKPYGGVYSSPTDVIQVINPKTIYFSAVVDETDVGKVVEGQKVSIILDAFPDKTFDSTVTKVEFTPSTSRSGGTGYRIHMPLTHIDMLSKLRLGMNGTVTIILDQKTSALTIPVDAVIYRDGKSYVDIKQGAAITRKEIKTGLETEDVIEVISGLNSNDQLVLPSEGK